MTSPRELPTVFVGSRRYFFDQSLAQLRRVDCPSDFIDLSDLETGALIFRLTVSELSLPESET